MIDAEMERAALRLARYAQGLFPEAREDRTNMALKLDHCLRVFQEAEIIAREEGLPGDATRTALWAALYHDVGRFPQYLRYATFDDRRSEDHGRLGVRVVKRLGFLGPLDPRTRKAVQTAIILHNKRSLPPGLPSRMAVPAHVVRDADKLDIYPVMLDHLRPGARHNHVVTLDLRDEPEEYSETIVSQIFAGQMGEYSRMATLNDFRLLLCSWIYDLNFPSSRRTVRKRGHLEELLAGLPETAEIRQVREKIFRDLRRMG